MAVAKKDISAPFDKKILAAARRIVEAYNIVIHREDGEWYGCALEFPEAMGDGKTAERCVQDTREALVAAVATMLEMGQTPPAPSRQGVRTEQVNVRLTVEEKTLLENTAKAKGFRGLSDFIRTSALSCK
jgi:predicted RNase H-like HicB family nuclease